MENKSASNNEFENFLNSYKLNKNRPVKTLLYLYRGNLGKLLISVIYFIIKNSPVWILPVVRGNIIDIVSKPNKHSISELWVNIFVAVFFILQNIPTHLLHVKYFSKAVRHVEAELRSTLVKNFSSFPFPIIRN